MFQVLIYVNCMIKIFMTFSCVEGKQRLSLIFLMTHLILIRGFG